MSVESAMKRGAIGEIALLMSHFNMCTKLVEKGVLTQQEAAEVMTKTANDIRTSTEEDGSPIAEAGETMAVQFERYAGFILDIK